jgi:hypothetical protein
VNAAERENRARHDMAVARAIERADAVRLYGLIPPDEWERIVASAQRDNFDPEYDGLLEPVRGYAHGLTAAAFVATCWHDADKPSDGLAPPQDCSGVPVPTAEPKAG